MRSKFILNAVLLSWRCIPVRIRGNNLEQSNEVRVLRVPGELSDCRVIRLVQSAQIRSTANHYRQRMHASGTGTYRRLSKKVFQPHDAENCKARLVLAKIRWQSYASYPLLQQGAADTLSRSPALTAPNCTSKSSCQTLLCLYQADWSSFRGSLISQPIFSCVFPCVYTHSHPVLALSNVPPQTSTSSHCNT